MRLPMPPTPIALAAALAGTIAWELAAPHGAPPETLPVAVAAALPVPATPLRDDAGRQAAILARPLFRPGRRPASPAEAAPRAAEDLPRLTALLSGPFGRRAIFAGANGRSTVVTVGSTLGGWTVQSIGAATVSVAGRDGERTLRLAYGAGAPEPPRPPAEPADEHGGGTLLRMPTSGPMWPLSTGGR